MFVLLGAIAALYGSSVVKESRRNIKKRRSRLRRKKQKNHLGNAWGSSTGWEVAVFNRGENWIPFVCGAVQVPGVHGVI